MVGKNNIKKRHELRGEKVETYSIKKFKVGAASVLIGVGIFFGAGTVEASDSVAQSREATNSPDEGANTANIVSENSVKPAANKIVNTHEKVAEAVVGKLAAQSGENNQDKAATKEVDKTLLTKKIEELKTQLERVKNNKKQQSLIDEATKKLESAETLLENNATQEEVDKKAKEISSYVSILKSIKVEVKDSENNDKKIETEKEVDNSSKETLEKSKNSEELKKVSEELSKSVVNAADLSSVDDKKVVEEAKQVLKEVNSSLENSTLTKAELDELFKRAEKSRNSVVNAITRLMSGRRDVRNGNEIPKTDGFRADATVSESALNGQLTFLDSNGNSKNVSEDTVPVVSNGDGKRLLQLRLDFSSSSATPIKDGKIRYIIPKNHLNTDVKPTFSNSALASGNPKDLSDNDNFIYEIPLNTVTGGSVGQINIQQQISSSIDKSPSAGDTTVARVEFYRGEELISSTTATAKYDYLSQILYKESDKKENKNIFDYFPGYYDKELIIGLKNSDGSFSAIKGNTFTLPFITYDYEAGRKFLDGRENVEQNGNGRLTDVDYTITGIPEFLELVPTVETNRYWTLEGNVAKLNFDKTSVNARGGFIKGNNGPVFRVKEGYFDNAQKMEEYLSSNGGKKVDIEYKAIGHRPDGSTYTQILATSEALNSQFKFSIGDGKGAIPGQRMVTTVNTPNKQRLFSNQSDTDEFNVYYGYNSGPLRDASGAMTPRLLKGNGDKLDNN